MITGEGKAFSTRGTPQGLGLAVAARVRLRLGARGQSRVQPHGGTARAADAALSEHALGGGLELAATADIRIAEPQARVGHAGDGARHGAGLVEATQRLTRRFGAQVVRRMVLGGEVFSGDEGLALGLVDDVVETGHALEAAMTYAGKVAERGPAAVQTAKLMIAAASGEASPEMAIDTIASILAAKTADLREGVDAFGEACAGVQGRVVADGRLRPTS